MAEEPNKVVVTNPDPTEAVKEAMTLAIKNLDEKLSQRLDAFEKAVVLARDEVKTANTDLAKANSEALKAALTATTETSGKLNEKIEAITERVNVWTGQDTRANVAKVDKNADNQRMISLVMMVIGLAGIAMAVITLLGKGQN